MTTPPPGMDIVERLRGKADEVEHQVRGQDLTCWNEIELMREGALEITRLRCLLSALDKIAKMKPQPIMNSGFQHGPALLLDNCQRAAREALRTYRKASK